MPQLKSKEDPITEELLESLIGKYIHAPTNEHVTYDPLDKELVKVNAWFAGKVAGYEKSIYAYDYKTNEFVDDVRTVYSILLCDGMAYTLSEENSVFEELSEDEFLEMLAEHDVKEASNIIVPEGGF